MSQCNKKNQVIQKKNLHFLIQNMCVVLKIGFTFMYIYEYELLRNC